MDYTYTTYSYEDEEKRRARRQARREQMRREKEKRERINRIARVVIPTGGAILLSLIVIVAAVSIVPKKAGAKGADVAKAAEISDISENVTELTLYNNVRSEISEAIPTAEPEPETFINKNPIVDGKLKVGDVEFMAGYSATATASTIYPSEDYSQSIYSILIDESNGEIVAARNAKDRIFPASMTKIMTVLVAAEHVTDLDEEFVTTQEMESYAFVNDCSAVNWDVDEHITIRDLFYGTILPSGGDAAYGLAEYVAGSQEAFVDMMNEKVKELGLTDTHFANVVGVHDEQNYSTAYDMAMILKAAVENDLCREVLSAHTYVTTTTDQHPDGITISNWFLRRIEDKDSGGLVLCAKTGFVNESRNCAASYMISNSGVPYICVTADAHSAWRAIYDHVGIYYHYTH